MRIPKVGERVAIAGQSGARTVLCVDTNTRTCDLSEAGTKVLTGIPWTMLLFQKAVDDLSDGTQ